MDDQNPNQITIDDLQRPGQISIEEIEESL